MKSGPHQAVVTPTLAVLAGATLLASLGISIATIALPTLARRFPATLAELQWVILAYLLAMTVTIVSAGRLADLLGHRRMLLAGLTLFTLASAICAFSPALSWLIGGRALQGIGGAILVALPMSLARETVPEGRMGATMGLFGTMSALGTALGPSLGGLVMANLGWQAAFFLLAIGGLLVLLLAVRTLPATGRRTGPRTDMDWTGTLLLAGTVGLLVLVISGAGSGTGWSRGLLLLLAVMMMAGFVRTQRTAKTPLVPLAMLRLRAVGAGLGMNLLLGAVMMSTLVVGPFFLSFALGLGETATGFVMAIGPVVAAVAGAQAGRLTDRLGVDRALLLGLGETVLGFVCIAILPRWLGTAGYIIALAVLTPGFQLFLAANNTTVMMAAPNTERGVLSGLLGLSRNLGLLTGAAVMTTLFTALVGTERMAQATVASIEAAYTACFLISAMLAALALILAAASRRGTT